MFSLTRFMRTTTMPAMLPVLISRVLVGIFFFIAGVNKLFVPENQLLVVDKMHEAGIAFSAVKVVVVAILECSMGLLLTLGF
ncbi:DoxX family membrane protein [Enterobacter hormaechei]|uniref:DoxX family membrane protein n=1 Tax=Enterobacter hormaechei TaxID=158836 RepID=UPI000B30D1FF|nr:DoxX family membrane protein [Enterobacter hormaechei]